jgi:two-component system OmpR family sensor kinase
LIKVSLRSGQAQIDIVDNGGGVAADELDRIFEPFTRGRDAVGFGHGLGLAIASRAIQAHGVRSAPKIQRLVAYASA